MASTPLLSQRKSDHILLTDKAQTKGHSRNQHFFYEPILGRHPRNPAEAVEHHFGFEFLNKKLRAPLWVSSMTGGTPEALKINQALARAVKHFGLGMGLGSCRAYLENPKTNRSHFDLRPLVGPDAPLFANLGIAQVEKILRDRNSVAIEEMVKELELDGLIIHVNPLQEWFQPEGDQLEQTPLETLKGLLELTELPIIVKEVGQGMGPASLRELMKLPLAAIDFGAFGGTNFSLLETLRDSHGHKAHFHEFIQVGHDAKSMVGFVNHHLKTMPAEQVKTKKFIISGGIESYLHGHGLIEQLQAPAVYGYAKKFLDAAVLGEEALFDFIEKEILGLAMACEFLTLKSDEEYDGN